MQPVLRTAALGIVFALMFPFHLSAQVTDVRIGTWELNLAKSKYSPGPAAKSATRTYEITGQTVKYVQKGMDAEGKPTLVQYTANYDGKDYALTGSPDSDMISIKRIDANRTDAIQKKAGKVVLTVSNVVSQDGKTMTVTSTGINAKGQTLNNVLVFDKR